MYVYKNWYPRYCHVCDVKSHELVFSMVIPIGNSMMRQVNNYMMILFADID